jgi:hypothetical protein
MYLHMYNWYTHICISTIGSYISRLTYNDIEALALIVDDTDGRNNIEKREK